MYDMACATDDVPSADPYLARLVPPKRRRRKSDWEESNLRSLAHVWFNEGRDLASTLVDAATCGKSGRGTPVGFLGFLPSFNPSGTLVLGRLGK